MMDCQQFTQRKKLLDEIKYENYIRYTDFAPKITISMSLKASGDQI